MPGVLRDPKDPESLVPLLTLHEARALLESDSVSGGMKPKIRAVVDAVEGGVRRGHILSGLQAGSVLLELFTRAGCGTLIVGEHEHVEAAADELAANASDVIAENVGRAPLAQAARGRPTLRDDGLGGDK